ncbi:HAD-IA family hydrolase [Saccharophagus degradans]|uniref:HAD family hydrolase n=1 Tax=Saccharophagus degradans TaxID=86304 RepID=UPI001C08EB35|nr:HAD-IA family hydrolase [Saccharophagus degradans]
MLYIFDWDGTISDSTAKICKCMQLAAQEVGLPVLSNEQIKSIIGLGLPEALHVLYPHESDTGREAIKLAYSRHFTQADVTPSAFFPRVMETLDALHEKGSKIAVATGKSRKGLNRVLSNLGLEDYFHASRCADETCSKPNPRMLQELLEEFDVPVDKAVMIGDTEYDMSMAYQINMPKIAVSYGAHSLDRMLKYEPQLCVDEFEQILNWNFEGK